MRAFLKGVAEAFVGGAGAATLALAIYVVAVAYAHDATIGDWLNFSAVVLGVAGTIGGTLAVDRLKERGRHRRSLKDIDAALAAWLATIARAENDVDRPIIADFRQQIAYLPTLSADLSRDAAQLKLALHAFEFHVPQMVLRLETMLTEPPSPLNDLVKASALNSMRDYAAMVSAIIGRT